MLKVLLALIFSITSITGSKKKSVAEHYCKMTEVCPKWPSIACKYTKKPDIKCNGVILKLSKKSILHWHNERRNLLALGKLRRFKTAARMATMKWSKELEQMAKYNVLRCKFGHDKCRNTYRFSKSGQNLYSELSSGSFDRPIMTIVQNGIKAWFVERKNCNMKIISKFREKSTRYPVGHFTAMMKYDSDYVGCAATIFKVKRKTRILVACNYATANVSKRPIYYWGPTGRGCKTGRNKKYKGLCSVNEDYGH